MTTTPVSQTQSPNGTKRQSPDTEVVPPKPQRIEDTQGTEASWEKALTVDPKTTTSVSRQQGQPKRLNPDSGTFIRIVVGGVVVAGLVAFAISFVALYSVAEWLGLPPWMWWAVPVFIDLAILVYAGLVLVHKARGERTWPSWLALGAFTVLSVVANGAHALAHSHETQWQAYIGVLIAAMVPIAIFVATEQLSRVAIQDMHSRKAEIREQFELESFEVEQQHQREELEFEQEQREWERQNKRQQAKRESEIEQRKHEQELAALQAESRNSVTSGHQPSIPEPTTPTAPVKRPAASDDALLEFVRERVAEGIEVTGPMVAEFLEASDRTGRRRLNSLKEQYPELFMPGETPENQSSEPQGSDA
ncbi:MAG: DUF2637 domain-containing protein [Micrococcaceae bacterium]|nr:DUF2637 domain-containing protein [Micrococcaceae bacterium]